MQKPLRWLCFFLFIFKNKNGFYILVWPVVKQPQDQMKSRSSNSGSLILLLFGALLIWQGYHIMEIQRWSDKYLFFIGLIVLLMGLSFIGYLVFGSKE